MTDRDKQATSYASPPCMAAEIAPDYFDPLAVDPAQARDVARWRSAQRRTRLAARPGPDQRRGVESALAMHLDALLAFRFGDISGRVVSAYWPIKSEPDLRHWMTRLVAAGATVALPVVQRRDAPLEFRPWTPGCPMQRGHWNILVPETDRTVRPTISLAPLVGWDAQGYRLGYGGGYFDRTLAALDPSPSTIGVGYQDAEMPTIYPQPHDIRLDAIVTQDGLQWHADA